MNEWYQPNTPKKNHLFIKILAIVLLVLTVLGAIALYLIHSGKIQLSVAPGIKTVEVLPDDYRDYMDSYYTSTDIEETKITIPKYEGEVSFSLNLEGENSTELTLQELYKTCSPWIVSISASEDGESYGYWGSGVIISPDGIILTNTHIIEGCCAAYVQTYDKTKYDVTFIAADSVSDIALLKIETEGELPYATFADSDSVEVGDAVAAIGCPLGETFRNTLTDGIISAIDRGISYNGHIMTLLQTDTALNEGNSGGALFNMSGHIIGITNMKMMSYFSSIEGIAFAIPTSTVETIVQDLITNGTVERTVIGITGGTIPQNVLRHYDIPNGIYVSEVVEGSGADDAGIQVGDIITQLEGNEVYSVTDINAVKDQLQAGDKMHFTIFRDGQTLNVTVVLKPQ